MDTSTDNGQVEMGRRQVFCLSLHKSLSFSENPIAGE
jgi:hypothetical protein